MEKSKGFRELIKDKHIPTEPLSISKLYDFLKDIHKDLVGQDLTGYPKHHVWEENGQVYSSWEIRPGMCTGDGGYKMFCDALKKEADKYAKSLSSRSSKRIKNESRKG